MRPGRRGEFAEKWYLYVEQQLDVLGEADIHICRWRRDSVAC